MTALAVAQVSKSFGGLSVLSDISFTVAEGETVGIMGANGAGKTTPVQPDRRPRPARRRRYPAGAALPAGLSPDRICRLGIARTFQIVKPFAGLTVLDNSWSRPSTAIPTGRAARCRDGQAASALAAVGLADRADDLAETLTLSGQKRLEVARAWPPAPASCCSTRSWPA